MPINDKGMNSDYIESFHLEEYVSRIKLLPYLLDHLESTNNGFDLYMKNLTEHDEEYIVNHWLFLLYQELNSNQKIENSKFDITSIADKSIFFDTLNINNKRIHELHNFVIKKEIDEGILDESFAYRNRPVNVSRINLDGSEDIFWRGANPEDVNKFMNDFIKIYKHTGISHLFANPFISSSLMHLLFVKIHPYLDGNGRTARVIHNIKFTEMINKLHGTRLKLSPLNLSQSIFLNRPTYHSRINNIYFDIKHDTNEAINKWFDFMLDMADEQIYYSNGLLANIEDYHYIEFPYQNDSSKSSGMRLSKLR